MSSTDLYIRLPYIADKDIVMDYRKECMEYGIPKSVGFPLKDANTYEEWLDSVEKNLTANDIQSQYLVFRKSDDMLIGLLSIRHSLNRADLK